jgi:hypothetical protein
LLVGDKSKKTFENIATEMCPVLSIQQYRISTMYWDDNYNTETVSTEVRMCTCPTVRRGATITRPIPGLP